LFQFTSHTKPKSHYTFSNYVNSQHEIDLLKQLITQQQNTIVISGKSGSGVTHLLNAICNEFKDKKTAYITSEWLVQLNKINKHPQQLKALINQFLKQDVIAIDNIQLLYKKGKTTGLLFTEILKATNLEKKLLILGCSDNTKDLSKSKAYLSEFKFSRIDLKELSSKDMFSILKGLCTLEDDIPDSLLYLITSYNGTVQEHINCLISVRFKSKNLGINLITLKDEDFESHFSLSSYFPKQQFRKHFIQSKIDFNTQVFIDKQTIK
jgi:chromosomal replication initiation ATPase DnaA